MLVLTRKVGYLRVAGVQLLGRGQRRLRASRVTVDSQPWWLSRAIISYLQQQKVALFFQIKRPLF